MSRSLTAALLGVGCLGAAVLAAPSASAVTMTLLTDNRSIGTEICGGGFCFESAGTPKPFAAWNGATDSTAVPGSLDASEQSWFTPTSARGSGSVTLSVASAPFRGSATSLFAITFSIDQPAPVLFSGDFEISVNPPALPGTLLGFNTSVQAQLSNLQSGQLFSFQSFSQYPAFDQGSKPFSFSGILPAGSYGFFVSAAGAQASAQPNFASVTYHFFAGVPEAPGVALAALTLASNLALLLRHRSV